jgi:tRNA acetyltransferase TAN1
MKPKRFKSPAIPLGISGILITHHLKKGRFAKQELLNIFNQHLPTQADLEDEPELSIEDQLSKEISAVKNQSDFTFVSLDIECLLFCKTCMDPIELVTSIFKSNQKQTRYTNRLIPIQKTCSANLTNILESLQKLISTYLSNAEPSTFAICLKIRNNSKLDKDTLITKIAELMDSKIFSVELKNPRFSIIVEVVNLVACLSIIENYNEYKKFNLESLVTTIHEE